jgi:hypothetical protein
MENNREKETIVDILQDIEKCWNEYQKKSQEQVAANEAYANSDPDKITKPEVVVDQDQIFQYQKAKEEATKKHESLRELVDQAHKEWDYAYFVLRDAIPMNEVWFKVSNGFLRKITYGWSSDVVYEFVSYADMLKKMKGENK